MVKIGFFRLRPMYVVAAIASLLVVGGAVQAQETTAIFTSVTIVENDIQLQLSCEILREHVQVHYSVDAFREASWAVEAGGHTFGLKKINMTEGIHRVHVEFVDLDNGDWDAIDLVYWCPPPDEAFAVPPERQETWPANGFTPDFTYMFFLALGFAVVTFFVVPGVGRRKISKRRFRHVDAVVKADRRETDAAVLHLERTKAFFESTIKELPIVESLDMAPVWPEVVTETVELPAVETKLPMLKQGEMEVLRKEWTECPYCSEWNPAGRRRCLHCDGRLKRPRGG